MILAEVTRRNGDIDDRVVMGDSEVSSVTIVAADMRKIAIQLLGIPVVRKLLAMLWMISMILRLILTL